jgi:hypothetical protein
MFIVMVICSALSGSCSTESIALDETVASPQACLMVGQPAMAHWMEEHFPRNGEGWAVKSWKCTSKREHSI